MTRRILRTVLQLGIFFVAIIFVIYLLDSKFRVLPNAIHSHLPAHHPGLVVTDVTVTTCSSINPFSNCKLDEKWHRIEKDLYLGKKTLSKAYLHVQRKREEELQAHEEVVFDIRTGRVPPSSDANSKNERWESRPNGLWVKKAEQRYLSDPSKIVTGVDVLFGSDAADPRSNWQLQNVPLLLDVQKDIPEARLTVRKGPSITIEKPIPRIGKDGKFKILQAADLHLSTGLGTCRDPVPDDGSHCEADLRSLDFLERILTDEQPDLVILTGDQVNGATAPDAQTAIYKYSALFAQHKIPYAAIFGNHDDEGNLDRSASMAIMDGLPYSLSTAGPQDLDGVGNYYLEILGRGSTTHSALTLYMLDTHSYSPNEAKFKGYDWLKPNQIAWFKNTAQSLIKKHKEYSHIHMDLAFIHIPLPEYRNPNSLKIVGNLSEPPTAPGFNSGFMSALAEENVLLVSCGHDHVNDYCVPGLAPKALPHEGEPALWMCYGGGVGLGGYGGYGGYVRRVRLFDIDMNEARITTYKRLEAGVRMGERVDEQIVVDAGRVRYDG